MNVEAPKILTAPGGSIHGIWSALRRLVDSGEWQVPPDLGRLLQQLERRLPTRG